MAGRVENIKNISLNNFINGKMVNPPEPSQFDKTKKKTEIAHKFVTNSSAEYYSM